MCVVDDVGFNQPRAEFLPAQRRGSLRRKEIPEKVFVCLLCFPFVRVVFHSVTFLLSTQDNGSRGDNLPLASLVSDEGVHRLRVL